VSGYLLDTNAASHVIRGDRPAISRRLAVLPMAEIAISAVTAGELHFGLARRGHPRALSERVRQFLLRVDILPWDHDAAQAYAGLRSSCESQGISLAALDMMIAAHAVARDAVLVTTDRAFAQVPAPLRTVDWATSD
jgi:tRNA(fMet)-specific endonuclease VapC